jgi:steroid delta-isomerase-like uncharacterized protein
LIQHLDQITRDFVCNWIGTYSGGDLDTCMACYADDIVFEDPIFGERVEGKPALRKAFNAFIFSGVTKLKYLDWQGGPEGGAAHWEWTANWGPDRLFLGFDASNKSFTVRGVSALGLRGSLIVRQTDFWDARSALQQLNVLSS